jgi:hypothetical protein
MVSIVSDNLAPPNPLDFKNTSKEITVSENLNLSENSLIIPNVLQQETNSFCNTVDIPSNLPFYQIQLYRRILSLPKDPYSEFLPKRDVPILLKENYKWDSTGMIAEFEWDCLMLKLDTFQKRKMWVIILETIWKILPALHYIQQQAISFSQQRQKEGLLTLRNFDPIYEYNNFIPLPFKILQEGLSCNTTQPTNKMEYINQKIPAMLHNVEVAWTLHNGSFHGMMQRMLGASMLQHSGEIDWHFVTLNRLRLIESKDTVVKFVSKETSKPPSEQLEWNEEYELLEL